MLQLSERLAAIAGFINPGETVADIGTDHGLLPIFLFLNGISPKIIMSDVKSGPLKKAEVNISKYAPGMKPDLRLGGGLDTLKNREVDAVVIAGMGGLMIEKILGDDPVKTRSFSKFVLQPENGRERLRIWLYKNGYTVTAERLVKDRKHFYEIFVVETATQADMAEREASFSQRLQSLEFEISPLLFSDKDPLLKELIECRIEAEVEIIESIREKGSGTSLLQLDEKLRRVEKLRELYRRI